jgi:hypothetical protein
MSTAFQPSQTPIAQRRAKLVAQRRETVLFVEDEPFDDPTYPSNGAEQCQPCGLPAKHSNPEACISALRGRLSRFEYPPFRPSRPSPTNAVEILT